MFLVGLTGLALPAFAAAPVVTSSTVDLTYDLQNPDHFQFGYRVIATGSPTNFDAVGLPPEAWINPSTGWINGSRTSPGIYDALVTATNAEGSGSGVVRFVIHPAAMGFGTTAGEYKIGQSIFFTVSFNANVTVTPGARLAFYVGPDATATARNAEYFSGGGTSEVVFRYIVQAGDTDADGISVLGNALQTDAIRESSGVTVGGSLPVRFFNSGVTIVAEAAPATTPPPTSEPPPVAGTSGPSPTTPSTPPPSSTPSTPPPATTPPPAAPAQPSAPVVTNPTTPVATPPSEPTPVASPSTPAPSEPVTPVATTPTEPAAPAPVEIAPLTPVVPAAGSAAVETSAPTQAPAVAAPAQLVNVSSRMRVADNDASRTLIVGFVISGSANKRVLVRAVGPSLAPFNVPNVLANPGLRIQSNTGVTVAENDNWSGLDTNVVASSLGAFPLGTSSTDAALVATLAPGAYTLTVAANGGSGEVLAEIYDADSTGATEQSQIVNLSTRGRVDGDANPLIAGFVIKGDAPRRVLIRAVGPGLKGFGVGDVVADPALKIHQGTRVVASNDNWHAQAAADIVAAGRASGAFPLADGSSDAAVLVTLEPGAYTAVVNGGVNGTSGAALVEVYEVPDATQ